MSDTDTTASLEEQIEEMLETDDADADSVVDSDASSDEGEETLDESEEDTTETESEPDPPDEEEKAVDFSFRDTPTSIENLVQNLKSLPDDKRQERISRLTRKAEIEAVREAFPEKSETAAVTRKELEEIQEKLQALSNATESEKLKQALEIADKLKATEGLTDSRLKSLMLQEKFGDAAKDITKDKAFIVAYEKFPTLSVEERLEYACSLSPVARKVATAGDVEKQARLLATKTVKKGKKSEKSQLGASDVSSLDDFQKLVESRLG